MPDNVKLVDDGQISPLFDGLRAKAFYARPQPSMCDLGGPVMRFSQVIATSLV